MPTILGEGGTWLRPMGDAERAFIRRNQKYVSATIARTIMRRPRTMPAEVVNDAALDGLFKAALTYQPGGGASESTYTMLCVRWALMEATERYRRRGESISLSGIIDTGPDYSGDSRKSALLVAEMLADPRDLESLARLETLRGAIADLPVPWDQIMRRRMAGEGFEEIGRAVGLSGSRVWQLHRCAIARLRVAMALWEP